MNFDSADLTSTSSYGIASGSPEFVTIDEKACAKFGNTAATAIKLTDKNGNSLLSGIDEFTVSFKVKPTSDSTSWLFYAAPNDNTQTYLQEKYIGAMTSGGKIVTERYNNNGARSESISASVTKDEWNDVMIVVSGNTTAVYINGERADEKTSAAAVSDILGDKSVVYIGRANWGSGEYATGYIDDFVIRRGVLTNPFAGIDLGDLSAVTENITVPAQLEDGTQIEWTTSNADVLTTAGAVVRGDDTQTVTLTASVVSAENGIAFSRTFEVTVLGYAAVINTFAAYSEENSIIFTSEYTEDELYDMHIVLYDYENNAVGEEIQNTAGGKFDELDNGTYKIVCSLTNEEGTEVRKVEKTIKIKEQVQTEAYLFAHFVGTESSANDEQIYFSVSTDGTEWKTLQNDSKPILTSTVGELGVRDPYILRGEDGKFFVIATDLSIYNRRSDSNRWSTCQTSGSKSIVVWESEDLINWSEARLVQVAPDNAGCTWAPEAVYDAEKDEYMVFWASKTSSDNYAAQRMYKSYTKDFVTFTDPEIYIDGGNISNIDTTITSDKGVYYRFTKNESKSSVTMMRSNSLSDGWEDVATYKINGVAGNTVTGYEGPTIYKKNDSDEWCLLLDYYSKSQGYKPFVTSDITKGEFVSAADFTFDAKYRHGTVMPITKDEYEALVAKYGLAE